MALYQALFVAISVAAISLFASRLNRSPVSIPMVALVAGLIAWKTGGVPGAMMYDVLTIAAEGTLAIVLFSDAANMDLKRLNNEADWSIRLLIIGLPAAFILGGLINLVLFPQFGLWSALLLAALLVPTDAALGAPVFSNKQIPQRIRDTILTESGLNDGLALPLVVFLACAVIGGQHEFSQERWLMFTLKQIGVGLVSGIVLGYVGGFLMRQSIAREFSDAKQGSIFALVLIAVIYLVTHELGGNSFVAVFAGGVVYGSTAGETAKSSKEFLETDGLLLTILSFIYIGAIILPAGFADLDFKIVVMVLLSLFIVRPVAAVLALSGTGLPLRIKLFFGWFGPRGLATALFALFVTYNFNLLPGKDTILAVTAFAVAVSTLLHGVSAHWALELLGKRNAEKYRETSDVNDG